MQFRLAGEPHTLVSLQDIRSELEEKEMEAWQQLTRVLTHEIVNSVAPIASLAATANLLLHSEGDGEVPLADAREAVLAQRRKRGMVLDEADHDTWSCGSFFTNPILPSAQMDALLERAAERLGPDGPVPPVFPAGEGLAKTSAAWLIDKAGYTKGHAMPGPAALSTKHTLALTNRGGATAADIAALAREVRDGVREAFGVTLVNEPVFVGHSL